ncbi:MAG TPA: F0F1 ATP synthase subunit B [Gemmatimonadales bacterium]|nr:F0F1 ATP synthase subunit B [Gemmatimonadales bacterium]
MALLTLLALSEGAGQDMGPFKVEGGLTLWTWVVFLTLLFLLKKFAWPAIVQGAEERERAIQRQLSEAEKLNADARAFALQQEKAMTEARTQAAALLAEAKSQAERERAAAVEKTKAEQEEMLARARREIGAERERAVGELRREAVELSLAAASKLVGERLDSAADQRIVTDYLATLQGQR